MNEEMIKEYYNESYSSFVILKKILEDRDVIINENNEILINGINLMNDDSKKLVLFNKDGREFRRSNKRDYKYLNFYRADSGVLVDYFLQQYNQYDEIVIKELNDNLFINLENKKTDNSKYQMSFKNDIDKSLNYYITTYIREFLNKNLKGSKDGNNTYRQTE